MTIVITFSSTNISSEFQSVCMHVYFNAALHTIHVFFFFTKCNGQVMFVRNNFRWQLPFAAFTQMVIVWVMWGMYARLMVLLYCSIDCTSRIPIPNNLAGGKTTTWTTTTWTTITATTTTTTNTSNQNTKELFKNGIPQIQQLIKGLCSFDFENHFPLSKSLCGFGMKRSNRAIRISYFWFDFW